MKLKMKKNNSLKSSDIQQHLQRAKSTEERSPRKGTAFSLRYRYMAEKSTWFLSIRWNFVENLENKTSLKMRERESVRCFCWLDSRLIWNGTHFQRAPTIQYSHARDLHSLVKRMLPSSRFADSTTFIIAEACPAKRWGMTSVAPLISDSKGSS